MMNVHALQDRLALSLGVPPASRLDTVVAMLANNIRRAPGYWIQLFLATGIATLGLALGSTGVVIGAMLVSPLMGPIVELGMGFAVGSALLVLRAGLCVALSVGGVIGAATIMTIGLPFHEVTLEIAARTSPTLLDLLVAVFCALMAAYTTIRQTTDTTAAAAGTAIGIALVPPLCVVGFGVGTEDASVASGALLLFVANFSAITVIAALVFLALGYERVDAAELEISVPEASSNRTTRLARRVHLFLHRVFGSRYGLATRLLVPVLFLLVVYLPLRRALDDVTWQFRVRTAISRAISSEVPEAMQSAVRVDRNAVSLRLVMVGRETDVTSLEERLTTEIAAAAGFAPTVSITAVPDARTWASKRATERQLTMAPEHVDVASAQRRVRDTLTRVWPASAGPLASWSFEISDESTPILVARHLGGPIGAAGVELLAQRLSDALGSPVRVVDISLPPSPVVAHQRSAETDWLIAATAVLDQVARTPGVVACVTGPVEPRGQLRTGARTVLTALENTTAGRNGQLVLSAARQWSVRVASRSCDADQAAMTDIAKASFQR